MRALLQGLLIILVLVVAACATQEPALPSAGSPATPEAVKESPTPELKLEPPATPETVVAPTPEPTIVMASIQDYSYVGASVAALEERIYAADVIVRGTLVSAVGDRLTFRAVEYLKGSGSKEFTVQFNEPDRDPQWDDQEAVLFLSQSTAGRRSDTAFGFADTTSWSYGLEEHVPNGRGDYAGSLLDGHEVTSRNPVWLPAESTGDARSVSASASVYITGEGSVSLESLRSKIAWVEGGAGIEGYAKCIRLSLWNIRVKRDFEAYYSKPYNRIAPREIPSGAPRGEVLHFFKEAHGVNSPVAYYEIWHEGADADLFYTEIVDDDNDSTTGWRERVATARPLPSGDYSFVRHWRRPQYTPCDFTPNTQLGWAVSVTPPEGTLKEALFDPVTDGDAVGAATAVGSISYEDGEVEANLTVTGTAGHVLDFIALDGSVTLSLDVSDATETDGVLSWSVADAPWSAGDQLMLRIRQPLPSVTVTLSPREEQVSTLTFTYTDILIEWFDPDQCDSRYLVGLYRGETVIRFLGFHPAPETTSFSEDTHMAWDTISNYDWNARVTCAPADGSEWRVVAETPMLSGLPASGS